MKSMTEDGVSVRVRIGEQLVVVVVVFVVVAGGGGRGEAEEECGELVPGCEATSSRRQLRRGC